MDVWEIRAAICCDAGSSNKNKLDAKAIQGARAQEIPSGYLGGFLISNEYTHIYYKDNLDPMQSL